MYGHILIKRIIITYTPTTGGEGITFSGVPPAVRSFSGAP